MGAAGTLEWWCPLDFGATPLFTRRRDPRGRALRVGPAGAPPAGEQAWARDGVVLRTLLPAPEGVAELVDFLPWAGPGVLPTGRIVRIATVLSGVVDLAVEVLGGGPDVVFSSGLGIGGAVISTGLAVMDGVAGARLQAGDRVVVTVDPPGRRGEPLSVEAAEDLRQRTEGAWRAHLAQLAFDGFHAERARRSLLTLATLTQASTGALVRSPVEPVCRLLDVARAAALEADLGLFDEAGLRRRWLSEVLEDGEPPLPAASDLDGDPVEGDDGVPRASLAAYVALVDAVRPDRRGGEPAGPALWDGLYRVGDWLAGDWAEASTVPDDLAAWYVLDRLATWEAAEDPLSPEALAWRRAAARLEEWLPEGFPEAPAEPALLRAAWLGPWAGTPDPAGRLVQRVLDHWADDDGANEPAAAAPRFAAVEALSALGRWDEAHARMEAVLADPAADDLSAATQLSLVAAAVALSAGPR